MALTSTLLATSANAVYTSSANSAITTMYVCNTGNIAVQFNLHAVPAGGSADVTNVIYYQVPLAARDTYVIDSEKLVLGPGDAIYGSVTDPALLAVKGLADTEWGTNTVSRIFWSVDRQQYLAAGAGGRIATSDTGESWTYISGLTTQSWPANIAVNDITRISYQKYVVVGDGGWSASSTDGITWDYTTAISGTAWGANDIKAVANNGSIYLAVGSGGRVATSLNGINWQFQSNLSQTGWGSSTAWCCIWDGDRFYIGGDGGKLAYSADGVTWTYVSSLANNLAWGVNTRVTSIEYSGSPTVGYLVVSKDNNRAATSLDGTTWSYNNGLATIGDSVAPGSASITYRPGYGFYVLGLTPKIYLLDLSSVWSELDNSLVTLPWNSAVGTDIVWNPSRSEFIAVGGESRVATSSDALSWTYRTVSATANVTMPNVVVTVSSIGI